jgi:hypothetical protein
VIQTCEKGENPWTEVPAEGQDPEQLEFPAPSLTITEATVSESDAATEPEADDAGDADDSDALGIVGLVVGAVGVVVGGIALARTRRQA